MRACLGTVGGGKGRDHQRTGQAADHSAQAGAGHRDLGRWVRDRYGAGAISIPGLLSHVRGLPCPQYLQKGWRGGNESRMGTQTWRTSHSLPVWKKFQVHG